MVKKKKKRLNNSPCWIAQTSLRWCAEKTALLCLWARTPGQCHCSIHHNVNLMTVCPVSMLQATFSLSASLISSKTATSCSRRKCWSGTECSWVNSSPYEIRGISRQHRAGMLAGTYTSVRTKTNTQLAVDWSGNPKIHSQGCAGQIKVMQCDEVMMGLPWDTAVSQGIMGVKEEEVKLWKTVKGVAEHCESLGVSLSVSVFGLKGWFILIWWVWESVSYVMSRSVTLRVTTFKWNPVQTDATHQQIHAFFASQGSMLHLLAARGEDVGALTCRGLHVGQTERPQVLHALLHLQLIT